MAEFPVLPGKNGNPQQHVAFLKSAQNHRVQPDALRSQKEGE